MTEYLMKNPFGKYEWIKASQVNLKKKQGYVPSTVTDLKTKKEVK